MKITLKKIREQEPCSDGWEQLLIFLGKTQADNEELSLKTILESNGFYDTLWCLQAVQGYDREKRLYAVWCARQIEHLMNDQRSIKSLDVAERFANGEATHKELKAARAAAMDVWVSTKVSRIARAAALSAWGASNDCAAYAAYDCAACYGYDAANSADTIRTAT